MHLRSAIIYALVGFAVNQVAAAAVEAPRDVAAPQGIAIATDKGMWNGRRVHRKLYEELHILLTNRIQFRPVTARTIATIKKAPVASTGITQGASTKSSMEVSSLTILLQRILTTHYRSLPEGQRKIAVPVKQELLLLSRNNKQQVPPVVTSLL
jgi:hypothetical protein